MDFSHLALVRLFVPHLLGFFSNNSLGFFPVTIYFCPGSVTRFKFCGRRISFSFSCFSGFFWGLRPWTLFANNFFTQIITVLPVFKILIDIVLFTGPSFTSGSVNYLKNLEQEIVRTMLLPGS